MGSYTIAFPVSFAQCFIVLTTTMCGTSSRENYEIQIKSIGNTSFIALVQDFTSGIEKGAGTFLWFASGR